MKAVQNTIEIILLVTQYKILIIRDYMKTSKL